MSNIRETTLPGVGRKFQIETTNGDRLVIVIHDDGTRELYHFMRKDPDRVASVVTLADSDKGSLDRRAGTSNGDRRCKIVGGPEFQKAD